MRYHLRRSLLPSHILGLKTHMVCWGEMWEYSQARREGGSSRRTVPGGRCQFVNLLERARRLDGKEVLEMPRFLVVAKKLP